MKCPDCEEENNVVKHGIRHNFNRKKQRYFCKKCEVYFVENRDNSGLFKSDYPKDEIEKVLHLWIEGKSLFKIWHDTSCSPQYSAIHNWMKKYPNVVSKIEKELKSKGKSTRKEIFEGKRSRREQALKEKTAKNSHFK